MDTLNYIQGLIDDYTNLMHKAMDNGDTNKVIQFHGSIVALSIVEDKLMRDELTEFADDNPF